MRSSIAVRGERGWRTRPTAAACTWTDVEITPIHFCDVTVEGAQWPVYGWSIGHPEGTILVDTGMIDSTPELDAEWGPTLRPWPELGDVVAVVNTHLHFDHCGGNRRFAGTPTYVQRVELAAAV